ncbi:MAG TPA: adenylate cyclase regulatory domain-containing protein [Thermoleophilaceae bacterium]|nr:adenylate cyclase regulatory domain-containing protein [Thermoleophilaceae bacterium]
MGDRTLTLKDAAERVGVSPATLRRWAEAGVIPEIDGKREWTEPAVAHARIVARLRERGHRLDQIREAGRQGRLAYGYIESLFGDDRPSWSLDDAADETGLEPALIERFWASIGLPPSALESLTDEDLEALRYVASVLAAGFPLVAFLQLCRVYGQSLSQIADAEVRLFHLYVHEPLMREGVPGLEMAEEMEGLARDLLPIASPLMDYVHTRFLQHFVAQDVVGHMEAELEDDESAAGRVRAAIAFADLAGYTRFTEEEGEEEALSSVERFVERVTATLPEDARVVKTIGDEVMVVGTDVEALVDWAVGFLETLEERPEPRLGINYGSTLYRDGDYFGREVNLASRVVARARGGEVLVTDSVVDAVSRAAHLRFEPIGSVKLKGFDEPRQLCRAARA